MRVPTGDQTHLRGGGQLFEPRLGRAGAEVLVDRIRAAVDQQRRETIHLNLGLLRERLQISFRLFGEMLVVPLKGDVFLRRLLLFPVLLFLPKGEHFQVVVPDDTYGLGLPQLLHDLIGKRRVPQEIPAVPQSFDAVVGGIIEDGREGGQIAVHITEQGDLLCFLLFRHRLARPVVPTCPLKRPRNALRRDRSSIPAIRRRPAAGAWHDLHRRAAVRA
jgi:hypothetical protein